MSEEIKVWGIHTLDDNLFLKENVIAIGWNEIGDLSKIAPDREGFKKKYIETFPDDKKMRVANSAGMLYRFAHEVQIGDYIVFPSKINREINIGTVESDYIYNPDTESYVQQRKVKWIKHLPRIALN